MPSLYEMLSGGMTAEEHREKSMLNAAKKRADAKTMPKPELDIHSTLDMLGMMPGVGVGADLLNTALFTAKGNKKGALMSLTQSVPVVGLGTALGKKLLRPSSQIKTATSYADAFQGWYKNLNELEYKNPGSVNWNKIEQDVKNNGMSSQSEGIYEWTKEYSKENFGNLVTVPKPSIAGRKKSRPKAEMQKVKPQKRIVKSPTSMRQVEELAEERKNKREGYFAKTKRSEY